jgi:hypothetical protein
MSGDDPFKVYEATLRKWSSIPNSSRRNFVFRENHAAFKRIRTDPVGQRLIRELAMSSDDAIAAGAATHALWFDPTFAKPILARLALADSEAGLSATWTLREFSRGALNLDW